MQHLEFSSSYYVIFLTDTLTSCKTKTGKTCILPFKYGNKEHDGCIKQWSDWEPWCATSVDEDGNYVKMNGSWDNCDPSCPLSSHNDDGTDTWF